MSTEQQSLSTEDSLRIITSMIHQAQGNLSRNSFYFLLWGTVVVMGNLGMYVLMVYTDYPYPHVAWLITVPAWLVSFYYGYRQSKVASVTTHLDRINTWAWISYGISIFIVILFGYKINYNINAVVMIMTAIPTLIAGVILKFKPLLAGSVCFWISGIGCFLASVETQFLIGALGVLGGYVIPGIILRYKAG